jgi:hypothetical protein
VRWSIEAPVGADRARILPWLFPPCRLRGRLGAGRRAPVALAALSMLFRIYAEIVTEVNGPRRRRRRRNVAGAGYCRARTRSASRCPRRSRRPSSRHWAARRWWAVAEVDGHLPFGPRGSMVSNLRVQARGSQNCWGLNTNVEPSPAGRSTQSPGVCGPGISRTTSEALRASCIIACPPRGSAASSDPRRALMLPRHLLVRRMHNLPRRGASGHRFGRTLLRG